jgi:hypothetical protein
VIVDGNSSARGCKTRNNDTADAFAAPGDQDNLLAEVKWIGDCACGHKNLPLALNLNNI